MTPATADETIPKAFVVGRGFSAGFGMDPVQKNLIEQVKDFIDDSPFPSVTRSVYEGLRAFTERVFPRQEDGDPEPPDVIELFSLLQAAEELKALGMLPFLEYVDPPALLRKLRAVFSQMLHHRLHNLELEDRRLSGPFFNDVQPGTVFLSLNWDNFLASGLIQAGLSILLEDYDPERVSVFKLHGSIDWIVRETGMELPLSDYQPRSFAIEPDPSCRRTNGTIKKRIKNARLMSIEDPERAWDRLNERFLAPILFTMGYGKTRAMAKRVRIRKTWHPAAWVLARADHILFIGYSLPPDDLEVRLLLREAMCLHRERYGTWPRMTVVDPCPDVQRRYKEALLDEAEPKQEKFSPDMVL